jgi:TonB family protein
MAAPDVFSIGEVARAAGVDAHRIRTAVENGAIATLPSGFFSQAGALAAIRLARLAGDGRNVPPRLFASAPVAKRPASMPLLASGLLHLAFAALLVLIATLGAPSRAASLRVDPQGARLVFLARPGPGGGGGGGGLRQPKPAARAEQKGRNTVRSPVPIQRVAKREEPRREPPRQPPAPPRPIEQPPEPPPAVRTDPAPPVVAPVASVPADSSDRAGVLSESAPESDSRGPGTGGGSGTGSGTGVGEGDGRGIGPGTGGGTGGGPYRPGSGITPPSLLREVKPDYTEEARRRNLEGEVVLEIVVRSDGRVGSVRIIQGLGAGLDQQAMDAVRQWQFSPARRFGTPVDVLVEVAVEFRVR